MTEPAPVHFFDILSALPGPAKSWSPNTVKIRLALNYKQIPYKQSYLSLPDIEPVLKSLSVPPNAPGTAPKPYTLPAIVHPSLKSATNQSGAINDSLAIALRLEELYPPSAGYLSLFPNGDASYSLAVAVNELMRGVVFAGYALSVPRIANILDEPRGREYFVRTRSEMLGRPLSEVRPTETTEISHLVEEVKKKMGPIVQMLGGGGQSGSTTKAKEGPFLEGRQPGFADFVFQAFVNWIRVADEDVWGALLAVGDGEVRALWDAVFPWLEGQGEEVEWQTLCTTVE
ncbi:hypothetical protein BJY01DRAFT_215443 [Aspergillus pseudoustus]|uniref:GST N-terminal domain-containing protein n=1 Tax=Aspergillus pseudoustus TaxID=1810923 RepID=A0ABR4JUK8_9EURO